MIIRAGEHLVALATEAERYTSSMREIRDWLKAQLREGEELGELELPEGYAQWIETLTDVLSDPIREIRPPPKNADGTSVMLNDEPEEP
jgi:hypothetical protein